MNAGSTTPLEQVMAPRLGTVDPSKHLDEAFDVYSIPAFDAGKPEVLTGREIGSAKQIVEPGDVLLSRIVPHLRRAWVVSERQGRRLIASGEWIVFRSDRVSPRYLRHVLVGDRFHAEFMRTVSGVGGSLLRARPAYVAKIRIPLPTVSEQERIAELLDRAEALRAKRRAALAQLDTLTQAIFLDMFGDPATNPKGWPSRSLKDVLLMPLRNGRSPSNTGSARAMVLTLSAITGLQFEPTAWKWAPFAEQPHADHSVDDKDFLICRGNGNLGLVGRGRFPQVAMPNVTFPDTMIAARVSPDQVERAVLQHVWDSVAVRRQIESSARTTNGTFKVNQGMLEAVKFTCPPLEMQRGFARRVAAVDASKATHRASFAELDSLFVSLQHRAFRGEL